MQIKKAKRHQRKLRIAIDGPYGSGKTYSLLRLAFAMKARGMCKQILVIDTERESASLYEGEHPDGEAFEFETINLATYAPTEFVGAIQLAVKHNYDCIIIDSLSHAWIGQGGALDLVDQKSTGNSFTAWKDVTPLHRRMVDSIIQAPAHMLVSMRSKVEYVLTQEYKNGRTITVPQKIGMAPQQRDGMEYEFDLYASMDQEHQLRITKSRCSPMQDAQAIKPGATFWMPLFDWCEGASAEQVAGSVIRDDRTPEERERDQIVEEMRKCETELSLNMVGGSLKGRKLSDETRNYLKGVFVECRKRFAVAPPRVEPPTVRDNEPEISVEPQADAADTTNQAD